MTAEVVATPPSPAPVAPQPVQTPSAAEWLRMSPDQRSSYSREQADRKMGYGAQSVHTRNERGELQIDGKPANGSQPAVDGTPAEAAPQTAGEKIEIAGVEMTADEWKSLAADKAQRDLRAATVPADPSGYEVKLPDDYVAPGGQQFQIDEAGNKASFDALRTWAHAHQIDQTAFASLLSVYGSHVAGEQAMIAERSAQEMAALGANAPQRVTAATKWLQATLGNEAARPIIATMATRHHVEFVERMMRQASSQGVPGFSQKHRDANHESISDEAYDRMSYGAKKEYAERMQGRR